MCAALLIPVELAWNFIPKRQLCYLESRCNNSGTQAPL